MTLRSWAVVQMPARVKKGFVAFERLDKAAAGRADGLRNEGECEFDHLHSEPRYAEYPCAASVFHNENLASGLSAVAPELNG